MKSLIDIQNNVVSKISMNCPSAKEGRYKDELTKNIVAIAYYTFLQMLEDKIPSSK